jgi:hypothetical protein
MILFRAHVRCGVLVLLFPRSSAKTLQMQMEVQKRLHEQLEVTPLLQHMHAYLLNAIFKYFWTFKSWGLKTYAFF